jgi:hypothetical protein
MGIQQQEISVQISERLRLVEDEISSKSAFIKEMVVYTGKHLTSTITEVNNVFNENMGILKDSFHADQKLLNAEMEKLKRENWKLHLIQMLLTLILLSVIFFPYLKNLLNVEIFNRP